MADERPTGQVDCHFPWPVRDPWMVEICQRLQSEQLRLSTAALTRDIVERPFRSSKLINGGGESFGLNSLYGLSTAGSDLLRSRSMVCTLTMDGWFLTPLAIVCFG
jgi:hypothetical protein